MSKGTNYKNGTNVEHTFEIDKLNEVKYKCRKVYLLPTLKQRKILIKWMDVYIQMYNHTLKFFKQNYYNKTKVSLNFQKVRTKYMKDIKNDLCNKSNIPVHILDGAIKDACTAYKSALTNLKNENIKYFRLRYIKYTKPQKVIRIENLMFSKNQPTFCKTFLGDKIQTSENTEFGDIDCDCVLQLKHNKFILYVPVLTNKHKTVKKKYKTIAIDPGIRTPYVGYSEDHVVEIGNNMSSKMSNYIKQIDSINKSEKSKSLKQKFINHRYIKISNLIDELHWKTIKYLTDNYKTILIGNLSTKDIVKNNVKNKLSDITKRISHLMRLNIFKFRLQYKCFQTDTEYKEVNEAYSSKTCSLCGNIKDNLGKQKIYECENCHKVIGRDINAARNIYMINIKK
jgi:putative transposase